MESRDLEKLKVMVEVALNGKYQQTRIYKADLKFRVDDYTYTLVWSYE